jgi:hypothetical protein
MTSAEERLAAVSPQALQKFNALKQPVSSIPNRSFTSCSREKQEPLINGDCSCWEKNMQETSAAVV